MIRSDSAAWLSFPSGTPAPHISSSTWKRPSKTKKLSRMLFSTCGCIYGLPLGKIRGEILKEDYLLSIQQLNNSHSTLKVYTRKVLRLELDMEPSCSFFLSYPLLLFPFLLFFFIPFVSKSTSLSRHPTSCTPLLGCQGSCDLSSWLKFIGEGALKLQDGLQDDPGPQVLNLPSTLKTAPHEGWSGVKRTEMLRLHTMRNRWLDMFSMNMVLGVKPSWK